MGRLVRALGQIPAETGLAEFNRPQTTPANFQGTPSLLHPSNFVPCLFLTHSRSPASLAPLFLVIGCPKCPHPGPTRRVHGKQYPSAKLCLSTSSTKAWRGSNTGRCLRLTIPSNREARDSSVRFKSTEASRVSGYQGVQIFPESCYPFSRCVSNPWHPYWWHQPRQPLLLHQRLPQTCWLRMAFSILPSTRLG